MSAPANGLPRIECDEGGWKEIAREDLEAYRKRRPSVEIDGVAVLLTPKLADTWGPPADYAAERTNLWSFPDRGDWATHRGNYRGNWSPYIPRNLLLKYTKPGDLVLDQMVGSGTTLVECKLLGRHGIGLDINPDAGMVTQSRLTFDVPSSAKPKTAAQIRTFIGDARDLSPLPDSSVDLVATHPPYAHIIRYTRQAMDGDLSHFGFPDFLKAMHRVAQECRRVLKPGSHCAILMGDTRKKQHHVPVNIGVLNAFLEAGFVLKEDIIKAQHKMKATRESWGGKYDFYLLAHEHLFVFRKPRVGESSGLLPWSRRWW